ncbi:hypothetical protein IL45_04730 [Nonlabens ulvanivorans]|uniref:Uncharacterized protein n=2 Tax=Nonlabens ulvanivorans TaxID=906888 RepID=A0A084JX37_NONUL|nr:hypothetical protein IL45_04730 [Nonlabens ulvanivorans]
MSDIDYIEKACRYDTSLSDLVFLDFFVNLGELSIDKQERVKKMNFLKSIKETKISEWQVYQYDELCILDSFWDDIQKLDELEPSLSDSVSRYVKSQLKL